jgi:hypothetical protein
MPTEVQPTKGQNPRCIDRKDKVRRVLENRDGRIGNIARQHARFFLFCLAHSAAWGLRYDASWGAFSAGSGVARVAVPGGLGRCHGVGRTVHRDRRFVGHGNGVFEVEIAGGVGLGAKGLARSIDDLNFDIWQAKAFVGLLQIVEDGAASRKLRAILSGMAIEASLAWVHFGAAFVVPGPTRAGLANVRTD